MALRECSSCRRTMGHGVWLGRTRIAVARSGSLCAQCAARQRADQYVYVMPMRIL